MERALTRPALLDTVSLAESRLRWADRRQAVLARNISNADTPGYRPQDVPAFATLLGRGAAASLVRTDARHIPGTGRAAGRERAERAAESSPDGNGVALDVQALKIAETDGAHALAMGLHRRWIGLYRAALGRGG